ncbi:MAG: hypothetical protein AB1689_24390 [Thermodesulfobacteriota bacterium]
MLKPGPVLAPVRRLAVPFLLLLAACGGGGDDAPNAPETLQLLMRRGDTMPGGLVVNQVESARMGADGSVIVIASRAGTPVVNGVYRRRPNGEYDLLLDENSPLAQGLTLTDVAQLLMAPTGEATFKEGGNRLDREHVFYFDGGQTTRLAGANPAAPPGFRKLGEMRIAPGGVLAFTYGVDGETPCTVDSSSGTERITCKLRLVYGTPDALEEVQLPNPLENQRPTSVGLEFNANGDLLVGLPSSGRNPLIGIVRGGVFSSLIERQATFADFGVLLAATPRAIASNGDVLFDARFDTDDDREVDDERIMLWANGGFTSIAELREPAGTKVVVDLRGIAIDDAGRATFQINFNDPDQATGPISLRQWDNGATREIAFEGQEGFGEDDMGNDYRILEIESVRTNRAGDVVFVARIGFIDEGTEETVETRLLRWNGAGLETVLRTGSEFSGGIIGGIETLSDINDRGDLLLIVELRGAGRALVLIPR